MKIKILLLLFSCMLLTACYTKREDKSVPGDPHAPKPPPTNVKSGPPPGVNPTGGGPGAPGGGMPKAPGK